MRLRVAQKLNAHTLTNSRMMITADRTTDTLGNIGLKLVVARHGIKVFGTVDEPLFVMAHIATKIGDTNHSRTAKSLAHDDGYVIKKPCIGIHPDPILLTKQGVCIYLTRSLTARPFVKWAMSEFANGRADNISKMDHLVMTIDKIVEGAKQ